MPCICCKEDNDLIDSHIISKFVRNRLTGIENGASKRFEFRWSNGRRPTQDLQKRKLMCSTCDNEAGSVIETLASRLLIPADPTSPTSWERLPFRVEDLIEIGSKPVRGAVYAYDTPKENDCIAAFALLTAWRALHAMALDGEAAVINFLNSPQGAAIDHQTASYFHSVHTTKRVGTPPSPAAHLYFLGPKSAAIISGKNDDMPFAWGFLDDDGPLGIGVVFGYWIILWPFFDESTDPQKAAALRQACFIHWHGQIVNFFRRSVAQ